MYELTFTHKENWRCAMESLVCGIGLREGNLEMISMFPYMKGLCTLGRYQQLWPRLRVMQEDFHDFLEGIQAKYAQEIRDLESLRVKIRDAHVLVKSLDSQPVVQTFPVSINITRNELGILEGETEMLGRLYMAQLNSVADVWRFKADETDTWLNFYDQLKSLKYYIDGLPGNAHHSISSIHYPEDGRILFDIYQTLRHRRSYDDNPEITPENRWKNGGWGVNYDEPFGWSLQSPTGGVPLVEIHKLESEDDK